MNVAFGKSKTVLVVSKQPKEIADITRHLSIAGHAILLARTGAGAMKVTKEHAPDVVLLEIDLSDMEGIDVVRAIRENRVRAGTPIIAISAFPYMRVMCLDNGCNGFIQKPIKALDSSHNCKSSPKRKQRGFRAPRCSALLVSFDCPYIPSSITDFGLAARSGQNALHFPMVRS